MLSSIAPIYLLSSPFLRPIKRDRENSFSPSKREAKYHPEIHARKRVGRVRRRDFSKDQQRSGRVTRIQVSWIEVKFCRVTEDPMLTLGRVENLGTAVCKRLVSDARKGREEVME